MQGVGGGLLSSGQQGVGARRDQGQEVPFRQAPVLPLTRAPACGVYLPLSTQLSEPSRSSHPHALSERCCRLGDRPATWGPLGMFLIKCSGCENCVFREAEGEGFRGLSEELGGAPGCGPCHKGAVHPLDGPSLGDVVARFSVWGGGLGSGAGSDWLTSGSPPSGPPAPHWAGCGYRDPFQSRERPRPLCSGCWAWVGGRAGHLG